MIVEFADKKLTQGLLNTLKIGNPLPRKGRKLIVALPTGNVITVTKHNNILYQVSVA